MRHSTIVGLSAVFLTALCVVSPALGSAGSRAAEGTDPYPVIPDPPFVVPDGGAETAIGLPDGKTEIRLVRPDGSLFAKRTLDVFGRPLETIYFRLLDGAPYIEIDALYEANPAALSAFQHRLSTTPASGGSPTAGRRTAAVNVSCGSDTYSIDSQSWASTMNWYWNEASTPPNLDHTLTLNALRNARVEWESNQNYCGFGDGSSVNFTYQGTTSAGYGSNGISTVGFGDMSQTGCGASFIACARKDQDAWTIYEADIRMKYQNDFWANNGAASRHDVQHIMAHETGHNIGFNHVGTNTNVMYEWIAEMGNTTGRLLGNGDSTGNIVKY